MRLILAYLNAARLYRARWHRRRHEELMGKVERYLKEVEGL